MKRVHVYYPAATSVLLGLTVLIGWFINSSLLVQLHPDFAPMQFNTALGFLISGVILFSIRSQRLALTCALSALLGSLGLLTLLQYIIGSDFYIDELFMTHSIMTKTSHPGRMSPPTALCFLLVSVSALAASNADDKNLNYSWASLSSSTSLTISLVAFLGYILGIEDLYGWQHLTRMAVHTSLGFIVVAFGFFSWLSRSDNSNSLWLQRYPQLVLGLGLTTSLVLWQSQKQESTDLLKARIQKRADHWAEKFALHVDHHILATDRMAQRWSNSGSMSQQFWEAEAQSFLKDFRGFQCLEWVAPGGTVRWVVPLEGNESTLNLDLKKMALRRDMMDSARQTKTIQVSQPTNLIEGGRGVLVCHPIYQGLQFVGLLFGVYQFRNFVDTVFEREMEEEFHVALLGYGDAIFFETEQFSAQSDFWKSRSTISVRDKSWSIELRPSQEWVARNAPDLPAISALIVFSLSMLFAILLYIALLSKKQNDNIQLANNELQEMKDQLELRVKARTEELEEKNSELERFTYTVSHDLKSPLVTIKGFLGLLEEDLKAGDVKRLKEDMSFIFTAVNQMQTLLNDLLELSRVGRIQENYETVDMNELLAEVEKLLATSLLNKKVQMTVVNPLPSVVGNRRRLLEVLQNLIENATKFMGDQEHPTIKIGTLEGHPEVFFVKDNGIGIDMKYHEKIFGLFERLSHDDNGTGIGLALVKRIIETHSGRIWVESAGLGQGTCFYFTINKELKESL